MAEVPITRERNPIPYKRTGRRTYAGGLESRPAPRGIPAGKGQPAVLRDTPAKRRKASADWIATHINLLRITDSLLVAGSVMVGSELADRGLFREGSKAGAVASAAVALIWIAALEIHRTRDPKVLGVGADEYKRVAGATFRVFGFLALAAVIFSIHGGAALATVSLPVGIVALTANRWAFRRRLATEKAKGRHLSRAIVVGEPEDVRYVVHQIKKKSGPVYEILGVCLPGSRRGAKLRVDDRLVPVLSSTDDIPRTARLATADAVIIAGPLPGGNRFIRELGWKLEECSAEMVLAATLTNVAGPRIHWRPVEGLPLMHVDIPQYSGGRHILKRVVDVALAGSALLVLSPFLLLLAAVVRNDSAGPVLFRQERIGKDGKTFGMYKFRSMVVDAEERLANLTKNNEGAGVLFKMHNDPRVTNCGRWMRKYSLDELPQLWNVLVGDMSLVGPRPPLASEVSAYERHTHRRLLIKPGLTGLWQINGRSDLSWDEAVRLDLYYVENWSIAGDLLILWRTFRAVVQPSGAY